MFLVQREVTWMVPTSIARFAPLVLAALALASFAACSGGEGMARPTKASGGSPSSDETAQASAREPSVGATTVSPAAAMPETATPMPRPDLARTVDERRMAERQFLPGVTDVQRWHEVALVGQPGNFAPSVVPLADGRYRMYANGGAGKGIVSLISPDGIHFEAEPGIRLNGAGTGALDCVASHPWVVAMDGGFRMYYQGDANCAPTDSQPHQFRVFSAFSKDGLTFTREGVRIDVGPGTGLRTAAHGRIVRMADGDYRMFLSVDLLGKDGPADVVSATSADGLTWKVDLKPVLERAHDPTIVLEDGKLSVIAAFLGDNVVALEAGPGGVLRPTRWLEFYDTNGTRVEEFGDIDAARLPDGRLAIYGSGKGVKGIMVMVAE